MVRSLDSEILTALGSVADQLDVSICYFLRGEFHFPLGRRGATIAVKPQSAGRLRICPCEYAVPRDMKWTTTTDRERLSRLVAEATEVMMDDTRERARGPA